MSRLLSITVLWLLLLFAAQPASGVMSVQPRNGTWEMAADGYEPALDVRDGPNLYAYVKQNPWTAWDPDGLASEKRKLKDRIEDGISDLLSPITALINKSRDQDARRTVAQETGTVDVNMQMGQARGVANSAPALMSTALAGGALNTMASGPLVLPGLSSLPSPSSMSFSSNLTRNATTSVDTKVSDTLVKASKHTGQQAQAMVSNVLKSRLAAKGGLNPMDIKFSQPTISGNFSSGGTLQGTIDGLRSGSVKVGDIPTIRVVEHNGSLVTLDIRRLAAFQNAGIDSIPVQRLSLSDPAVAAEFATKYNPINGGNIIVVTPNASGRGAAESLLRQHGKIE